MTMTKGVYDHGLTLIRGFSKGNILIQVEHANAQLLYGLGKMQKTDFFKIFFYQ